MSCFTSFRVLILIGYQPNDKERTRNVGDSWCAGRHWFSRLCGCKVDML